MTARSAWPTTWSCSSTMQTCSLALSDIAVRSDPSRVQMPKCPNGSRVFIPSTENNALDLYFLRAQYDHMAAQVQLALWKPQSSCRTSSVTLAHGRRGSPTRRSISQELDRRLIRPRLSALGVTKTQRGERGCEREDVREQVGVDRQRHHVRRTAGRSRPFSHVNIVIRTEARRNHPERCEVAGWR
jgi:hypothetical protein